MNKICRFSSFVVLVIVSLVSGVCHALVAGLRCLSTRFSLKTLTFPFRFLGENLLLFKHVLVCRENILLFQHLLVPVENK